MFVAAIGLVVRSAIGPVERLLNMLGHQHICALAYALAFVMNVVLCIALVPRFGGHGAAAATSLSLTFETVLLFWIVRRRLGLHVLAFGEIAPKKRKLRCHRPLACTGRIVLVPWLVAQIGGSASQPRKAKNHRWVSARRNHSYFAQSVAVWSRRH